MRAYEMQRHPAHAQADAFWLTRALLVAGIIAVALSLLWVMGRPLICTCGYVKVWHGVTASSENSQHLTDWYTFTHVNHGLLFYSVFWFVCRLLKKPFRFFPMLTLAVFLESAWEVIENSNFIIDRYRQATIALDYYGDSIVNSGFDILAMMAGFLIAHFAPVLLSVTLVVLIESLLALLIHDNLLLNIIMLIYPLDTIRIWQQAG
jgi:hypothetical protein